MTQGREPSETPILFEVYHENSKQRRHDLEFNRRISLVNGSAELHRVMARAFKSYPGAKFEKLPAIEPGPGPSFELAAAMRRSIRRFSGAPMKLDALARMLHFGGGLTGTLDETAEGVVQPVRAAPSAGALYPIEIYLAVAAVEGLEAGLYHYSVARHGLELLRAGRLEERISVATFDPATFSKAAVVFILTGVFGRTHFKYGERGYRFALLEAGHIGQNILLSATAQDLGAVLVGGFIDDEVNAMLDLDGVDEAALCMIAAGPPGVRPVKEETPAGIVEQLLSSFWSGDGFPVGEDDAE